MAAMAAAAWAFVKSAIAAVAAGTATAGQIATVVAVNVAGSVALSAVGAVLMKPNVGGRSPGEWLADPNAGIPFAIGDRIGAAGNIVYKNTYGKDNEYKSIVTVHSGAGPIGGYLGFTADREPIVFSGEAATGRYGGEMWMQRRLGDQPDTALTSPAAITYQKLPDWGPNHRLSGKAASMWTLRMDSKFSVYPQGEPAPITIMRGIKGYDHRYDSTMPGGSGPCRLNDRSTYRVITNPIIADLNWCLGLRENGKVVGGLGVSSAGIDWSAYTVAANVADINRWTLAAYPRSDEAKSEVRAAFLQAGGAVISRRAGLVSCVSRGAPKVPVMRISAADTAGPIELDTAANVLNRYNTMTPRYLSEAHEWQLAPASPVSSSVYVEEDRGRVRSDQRDYPYVDNAKQAVELCALDIAHSREGIGGRWPLKPYCRDIEPGDTFTVDEPGLLIDNMDMLALDRDYDPATDTYYVVFVSETPGKVPWALGQQANPSPTPSLSARHDLNAPHPDAWDVVIVPPSPEGVSTPGAEVVIDIDNVRAEDLIVEIGPSRDGPWRVAKTVSIVDGQLRIPVNELTAGEVFWVALSYRSADDGPSPKTIKGPFEAGKLIAGDTTHLNGFPVQDILDQLTDVETLTAANAAAVADMGERVDGVIAQAEDILAGAEGAAALAVLKAGEAGEAAEASNIAASIATTKADDAGAAAQAANAAKLDAQAASDVADQKAQASVLASAQAEAFAGDAGDWARASEGAAVRAEAQAAQGLTYLNQTVDARDGAVAASIASGTSAGLAASERQLAEGARDDARAAAATAVDQSSSASAAAASAQISANLAAKVGLRSNRLINSDFSSGLDGWSSFLGGWATYTHALFGSMAHSTMGGDAYLVSNPTRVERGETYTCSAVGDQGPGGNTGAMYFRYRREDMSIISDGNALVGTLGISWENRIRSTFTVPSDCVFVEVIFWRAAAHTYPLHISKVMLTYGSDIVPWNNDAQASVVSAQMSFTAAVAADAADRMSSVRFDVSGGAGGDPFQVSLRAGPDGSMARIVASEVCLSNVVNGQVIPALVLRDGNAELAGNLRVRGDALIDGTVNGMKLEPNSVTPLKAFYQAGVFPVSPGGDTVAEVVITTKGGPVMVTFNALYQLRHEPSGSFHVRTIMFRTPSPHGSGEEILSDEYLFGPGNTADNICGKYPIMVVDNPPAGTWRYAVNVRVSASNMTQQDVSNRYIGVMELRSNS